MKLLKRSLALLGLFATLNAQPQLSISPATEIRFDSLQGIEYYLEVYNTDTDQWEVAEGPLLGNGGEIRFYYPLYTSNPELLRVLEGAGGDAPLALSIGLLVELDGTTSQTLLLDTGKTGFLFSDYGVQSVEYTYQRSSSSTGQIIILGDPQIPTPNLTIDLTFATSDDGFFSSDSDSGSFALNRDGVGLTPAPSTLEPGTALMYGIHTIYLTAGSHFIMLDTTDAFSQGTFVYSRLNSYQASFDLYDAEAMPQRELELYFITGQRGLLEDTGLTEDFQLDTSLVGQDLTVAQLKAGEYRTIWQSGESFAEYQLSATQALRYATGLSHTSSPTVVDQTYGRDGPFAATIEESYNDYDTPVDATTELYARGNIFGYRIHAQDGQGPGMLSYFEYDSLPVAADYAPSTLEVGDMLNIQTFDGELRLVILSATDIRALPSNTIDSNDPGGTGTFTYTKDTPVSGTLVVNYLDDLGQPTSDTFLLAFEHETGGTYLDEEDHNAGGFSFDDDYMPPTGFAPDNLAVNTFVELEDDQGTDSRMFIITTTDQAFLEEDATPLAEFTWSYTKIDLLTGELAISPVDSPQDTITQQLVFGNALHGDILLDNQGAIEISRFRIDQRHVGQTTRPEDFAHGDRLFLIPDDGQLTELEFTSATTGFITTGESTPDAANFTWTPQSALFGTLQVENTVSVTTTDYLIGFGGDQSGIASSDSMASTAEVLFAEVANPAPTPSAPSGGLTLSLETSGDDGDLVFFDASTGFCRSDLLTFGPFDYTFQATGPGGAELTITPEGESARTFTLNYASSTRGLANEIGQMPTISNAVFRIEQPTGDLAPTALAPGDAISWYDYHLNGEARLTAFAGGHALFNGSPATYTYTKQAELISELTLNYTDPSDTPQTRAYQLVFHDAQYGGIYSQAGQSVQMASDFRIVSGSRSAVTAPEALGNGDYLRSDNDSHAQGFSLRFISDDHGVLLGYLQTSGDHTGRSSGQHFTYTYTKNSDDRATLELTFPPVSDIDPAGLVQAELYFEQGKGTLVRTDLTTFETSIPFTTNIQIAP